MLPPKKRKTYESSSDTGATYIAIPKQVKSYVNRAIRKATELKYIDFDINGTASTTGTYQVKLNTIGVGTGYNQRIGDSVKLRRIEWDLQVQAGDNFNVTRTIIGACRNATYPPVPLSSLTSGTNPDFGPYLLDKKNFVKFTPADGSTGTQITEIQFIKGSRKMKHHLQFNVGSLTSTNWNIYLQFHSDSALVPHPSIKGYVRIWFTDQ